MDGPRPADAGSPHEFGSAPNTPRPPKVSLSGARCTPAVLGLGRVWTDRAPPTPGAGPFATVHPAGSWTGPPRVAPEGFGRARSPSTAVSIAARAAARSSPALDTSESPWTR